MNSNIKIVKKSDILLLKVFCDDEYFSDCDYACIRITDHMRKELVGLKSVIDMVLAHQEKDESVPTLYKMSYWSPSWAARFIDNADMPDGIEFGIGDEYAYINREIKDGDRGDLRCDAELMHVYQDGIMFDCLVKHAVIRIETAIITFNELGIA